MFELKTIEIKNFLSFGKNPTKIDFTTGKTWLAYGSNGSGKSTIIEAIHFGLYGTPYRNAKVEDVINRVNKEECEVKIEFNNGGNRYLIERGLKPRVLKVFCNDEQIHENVSKKDFQKVIDDIIGVPYNVFSQLTIIDNTFYTPFMELSAQERRMIIDKVFGLDQLTLMLERGKDFKTKIATKIVEGKGKVEVAKEKIRLSEQYAIAALDKDIAQKEEDVARFQGELQEILSRGAELKKEETECAASMDVQNTQITQLRGEIKKVEAKERTHETNILEFERHVKLLKAGKCKECGHAFENAEEDLLKIENQICLENSLLNQLRENELQPLNERLGIVSDEYELIRQRSSKIKTEISLIGKQYSKIETQFKKGSDELTELKTRKETGVVDTTELQAELKANQDALIVDTYMHNHIIECEKILSDGGVRSYIIKKFLPSFNATVKKYLQQMEAGFAFTFDSEFNDCPDERYRNSFAYGNLSTGQRARVNFAITFALIEFVEKRNSIKTDLVCLDEALEGGLDDAGKESIINILQRGINKRLLVVSHDSKLQDVFEKRIHVQLQGSFSKVSIV